MEFIETYLGLSPDGGDGSWEIAALVLLVGFGTVVGLLLPIAANPTERNPWTETAHQLVLVGLMSDVSLEAPWSAVSRRATSLSIGSTDKDRQPALKLLNVRFGPNADKGTRFCAKRSSKGETAKNLGI